MEINVIDAQVVYAVEPLNAFHRTKVSKYDTLQLKQNVAQELGVLTECVRVISITLLWKGVWSSQSARDLIELGLAKLQPTLTAVVLRGSHLNWSKWNKMITYTSMVIARIMSVLADPPAWRITRKSYGKLGP